MGAECGRRLPVGSEATRRIGDSAKVLSRGEPAHIRSGVRRTAPGIRGAAWIISSPSPTATPISRTGLAAESLLERQHLQEWVIANPQVRGESVLVVTEEYDRWADTDGVPARDRLDVLGLDTTGRLVVVELKRGTADRDVHLQAIIYAALVSRFDLDTLAQHTATSCRAGDRPSTSTRASSACSTTWTESGVRIGGRRNSR